MRFACAVVLSLLVACRGPDETADTQTQPVTTSVPSSTTSSEGSSGTTAGPSETTAEEDDSTSDAPSTTATTEGSSTGTLACAPAPDASQAWIAAYVDDVVARLSGARELSPGITVPERSTAANRAATADWLEAQFEALGLVTQRHAYSSTGTNIAGLLPATEPGGRTIVIGAHFDTVPGSPGANDNATGVAFVLSLARYLSSVECRAHDVIFVGFDEEEIGLIGSDAFAQLLLQQQTDVLAVHTIDQMGWDQDGDRAIELERADEGLFEFYEVANATLPAPLTIHGTNTGFTDHVSFRPYGFAAVGITEEFVGGDTTPHYHLASDTYETVNMDLLVSTCVLGHTAFAMLIDAA